MSFRNSRILDQIGTSENGTYSFKGDIYVLSGEPGRMMKRPALSAAGAIISAVISGCITTKTDGSAFAVFAYIAAFILSFTVCFDCARIVLSKGRLRSYIYDRAVSAGKVKAVLLALTAFAAAVAGIIPLFSGEGIFSLPAVCYAALMLLCGICGIFYGASLKGMHWERETH